MNSSDFGQNLERRRENRILRKIDFVIIIIIMILFFLRVRYS